MKQLIILFIGFFSLICLGQIKIYKSDLIGLYGYEKGTSIYKDLKEVTSFNINDVTTGSAYTVVSGIGLGFTESKNFGYKFPGIPNNTWFKNWYNRNTAGDGIFSKSFDFNKISRNVDYIFDRLAVTNLERFYSDYWYSPFLVYIHMFILKNTTASIIRSWAKYDKPFYDFSGWEMDFNYIINRLFIER